jgi:hypothetical protein
MKRDEIGGACDAYVEDRNAYIILMEKLRGKKRL